MACEDDAKIMTFTAFKTKADACEAAAAKMLNGLQTALHEHGKATLLLSGGSTPAPAYKRLAVNDLPWHDVTVGLVDERWVDGDSDASNTRLLKESFLDKGAGPASFIAMKTAHDTPQAGEADVNTAYSVFAAPDVVLLGMGPDGHTASWFPDSVGLARALSDDPSLYAVAIDATDCSVAGNHTDRMTVTLNVVKAAKTVILLITGEEKRAVLEDTEANLPIHRALAARKDDMEVIWAP